jgi:hypothetical protein
MINFSFSIENPFSKKFKGLIFKHGPLSSHKRWELEVNKTNVLLGLSFALTAMRDHAGLIIGISLLTFEMHFQIYDTRHWNRLLNSWE